MFIIRIYRPDDAVMMSWMDADKPAKTLFHGLVVIEFTLLICTILYASICVKKLLSIPMNHTVPVSLVNEIFTGILIITIVRYLVIEYVESFVAQHIVLEKKPFMAALTSSLKKLGFWYVKYIVILSMLMFILITFLTTLTNIGITVLPALIINSPAISVIVTLPLFLVWRLWTLNIVFKLRPDMSKQVPLFTAFDKFKNQ